MTNAHGAAPRYTSGFAATLCGLLLLVLGQIATAASTSAGTQSGTVRGYREGPLIVYKGVPFAAPPLGADRWREPQPVVPWRGVRTATQYGRACMQRGVSMPGETPPATSEDCLYLNIWTPARRRETRLPVLVWIHGGGFSNGSPYMPLYRGDRLAEKGLVVITISYRLGPFGFLALPELTRESPHQASGNYGLMDQIAALRWVQRNIAAFGGDPDRVTIAGQSAGATSVSILMASPQAKGLFARAIGQSGGLFEPTQLAPGYLLANAEREGVAYARAVGASTLAELRALPAAALLNASADAPSHPIIEPYVLPRSPYDVFVAGDQAAVPVLIGSNADEARSLVTDLKDVTATSYEAGIIQRWGALPPALYTPYPHSTDQSAVQARLAFERDLRFGWDLWTWARLSSAHDGGAVFYYQFAHAPPFPADSVYGGWGAGHYAELWYVFDHLDHQRWAWTAADRRLATLMSTYWSNFVRTGDPNGASLPRWPLYSAANPQLQVLDDPAGSQSPPDLGSLRNIDTVYDGIRGKPFGQP